MQSSPRHQFWSALALIVIVFGIFFPEFVVLNARGILSFLQSALLATCVLHTLLMVGANIWAPVASFTVKVHVAVPFTIHRSGTGFWPLNAGVTTMRVALPGTGAR